MHAHWLGSLWDGENIRHRALALFAISPQVFCEAAPRVKYDLYLPLKHLQLFACHSSCCSAFCSRSVTKHTGLGAFGLSKEWRRQLGIGSRLRP